MVRLSRRLGRRDAKKDKQGNPVKSALGSGWGIVVDNIEKACVRQVAVMCERLQPRVLIEHFHSDTLEACTVGFLHAKGGFPPWHSIPESRVEFRVDEWDKLNMLPPRDDVVRPISNELAAWVKRVDAVREDWARVKFMANWLDDNCTLGAIRYYWPSMLLLAPEHQALHQASPEGFRDNPAISRYLPLLRETATTVAALKLMPEIAAGAQPTIMALKLKPHAILYCSPFNTDQIDVPEFIINL